MRNILLVLILAFGPGTLKATEPVIAPGNGTTQPERVKGFTIGGKTGTAQKVEGNDTYFCQAMLVRVPTASVKALADPPTDPWPLAAAQITSGKATLIAAPSVITKGGQRVICEAKNATLEIEPTPNKTGGCDADIKFTSTDVNYQTSRDDPYLHFEIGSCRILSTAPVANDPAKSTVLLFRVLLPAKGE